LVAGSALRMLKHSLGAASGVKAPAVTFYYSLAFNEKQLFIKATLFFDTFYFPFSSINA
jgi:hypothetical protein